MPAMPVTLIFIVIKMLPDLFAAVNKLTSLTGNTHARVDAAVALLVNAIPDSLAPAFIPEAKTLIMDAVAIYDKVATEFEKPDAAAVKVADAPVADTPAAVAPVAITGTLTGVVASLGAAMPE